MRHLLRELRKQSKIPVNFYRGAIESIPTRNITSLHGLYTVEDRKARQLVNKTAQNITHIHLQIFSDDRSHLRTDVDFPKLSWPSVLLPGCFGQRSRVLPT